MNFYDQETQDEFHIWIQNKNIFFGFEVLVDAYKILKCRYPRFRNKWCLIAI